MKTSAAIRMFNCKIATIVSLFFAASPIVYGHCYLSGATKIPYGSTFAVGPTAYSIMSIDPSFYSAFLAARDAWDRTDARNYVGNWNSVVTSSDCPAYTGQTQASAFNWNDANDPLYNCPTLTAAISNGLVSRNDLAFVDYYQLPGCPTCGTKSIIFNLGQPLSTIPDSVHFDFQSLAAHEFGHVLGLGHAFLGLCNFDQNGSCASSPTQETMARWHYYGDTCQRNVESHDRQDANAMY